MLGLNVLPLNYINELCITLLWEIIRDLLPADIKPENTAICLSLEYL